MHYIFLVVKTLEQTHTVLLNQEIHLCIVVYMHPPGYKRDSIDAIKAMHTSKYNLA